MRSALADLLQMPVRPARSQLELLRPRWPAVVTGSTVIALMTLGSGLLNLYSAVGRPLPHRAAILRGIFPMEFLHVARSLTLLTGFALVILSVNIYKRKKRAFFAAATLASVSALFHLT